MKDAPALPLPAPGAVLATYERHALGFAQTRDRSLFERRWIDRALGYAPGKAVLDLGCGTGLPLAAYLADRRCRITGVDGAAAMLALFEKAVPAARAVQADIRGLDLGARFDLLLAWDSLTHLAPDDQRAAFAMLAGHARPRAALLFTSGSAAGETAGRVDRAPVYRASLSPDDYRACLAAAGFSVIDFVAEDPACARHSVWLARYTGAAPAGEATSAR